MNGKLKKKVMNKILKLVSFILTLADFAKELTEKITVIRDEVISVNSLKDVVLDRVENLSAIFEETAAGSELSMSHRTTAGSIPTLGL